MDHGLQDTGKRVWDCVRIKRLLSLNEQRLKGEMRVEESEVVVLSGS